jgi:hypothetical protein
LTTLGYAKSRETTISLTNLIWKDVSIRSFLLFNASDARDDDPDSPVTAGSIST